MTRRRVAAESIDPSAVTTVSRPQPVPLRHARTRSHVGTPAAHRLQSLDAFRGITIAAMILVNNPGSWEHVYAPFRHAAWNGCTPTDLIFPFFLFIIGVAITFSFDRRRESGASRRHLYANIARRTVLIFGLGIFLNGFPLFDWSVLRIPGVLQRIALCYGCVALLVLNTGVRGQSLTAVLLLVSYWLAMVWVRVPGKVSGGFEVEANLAAYVDTLVLRGHLLHEGWDPEGILSTLPAVATTLAGVLAGQWIRAAPRASQRVAGLVVAGSIAIGGGLLLDHWCPINKSLWTSSYVLFTAGIACAGLAACYWFIDINGHRRWATPFII
jgi:predicted acyltransferase